MHPKKRPPIAGPGDVSEDVTLGDEEWPVDQHYLVEPGALPSEEGAVPAPAAQGRRRPVTAALALVLLAVLLALGLGAWTLLHGKSSAASASGAGTPTPTSGSRGPATSSSSSTTTTPATPATTNNIVVPDATGLTLSDARSRLSDAGLRARIQRQSSNAPMDQVLRQSPDPGAKVSQNSAVALTVSAGAARITVPELVGIRADSAAKRLRALHLVPQLHLVRSTNSPGTVLVQNPVAGARVARGSVVRLGVATSATNLPAVVRVPSVVGSNVSTARQELAAAGFRIAVVEVASSQPNDMVVLQSPASGTRTRKGSTVRISVSSGPAQVTVPTVVGLDRQSAENQLQAAGFQVQVVTEPTTDPSQDGMVAAQNPQGGTKATGGSTVTITVDQLGS